MTGPELSEGDRQLLADVLAGKLPLDDAAVAALFARVPEARRELEELRRIAHRLDRDGRSRGAELGESAAMPVLAADRDAALAAIAAWRRGVSRRKVTLVAAAAGLLLALAALAFWLQRGEGAREHDPRMHAGTTSPNAPVGPVQEYGKFRAAVSITGATRCMFVVFRSDSGKRVEVARSSENLTAPEWEPSPLQRATIEACPAIAWELHVSDPEEIVPTIAVREEARKQ